MASALITLTTAGANTGPFNLASNTTGFATNFETGVSKSALLAGYTSSLVPVGTTTIRVKSTSVSCSNYIDIVVGGLTTTTTTTTAIPPNSFLQNDSNYNLTIKFTIWVKNTSSGSVYAAVYSSPAPVFIASGDVYNFYQSVYPGIYPTNNKAFKITINSGSIGIKNAASFDASVFYLETLTSGLSGNTSFAYFDNNSPAATTATDSLTSASFENVPAIYAHISSTA
jgi:hypothetical protein